MLWSNDPVAEMRTHGLSELTQGHTIEPKRARSHRESREMPTSLWIGYLPLIRRHVAVYR